MQVIEVAECVNRDHPTLDPSPAGRESTPPMKVSSPPAPPHPVGLLSWADQLFRLP